MKSSTTQISRASGKFRRRLKRSGLREISLWDAVQILMAIVLIALLAGPSLAQDDWETVEEHKAILEFENATRVDLQQRLDGETLFEQSDWVLADGSTIYFHVTRLGPRWTLIKQGNELEKTFRRAFPGAELVEVGEPFVNRDRGTQGDAQWLRFRQGTEDCVLIRQYGWDDDSFVSGRTALGDRVVHGHLCTPRKLDDLEIKLLFERIDF